MADYREYAPYLEAKYGQRVYKLPINYREELVPTGMVR